MQRDRAGSVSLRCERGADVRMPFAGECNSARTWLMCTPSERCTPLQERQMKQPRFADALCA